MVRGFLFILFYLFASNDPNHWPCSELNSYVKQMYFSFPILLLFCSHDGEPIRCRCIQWSVALCICRYLSTFRAEVSTLQGVAPSSWNSHKVRWFNIAVFSFSLVHFQNSTTRSHSIVSTRFVVKPANVSNVFLNVFAKPGGQWKLGWLRSTRGVGVTPLPPDKSSTEYSGFSHAVAQTY